MKEKREKEISLKYHYLVMPDSNIIFTCNIIQRVPLLESKLTAYLFMHIMAVIQILNDCP